MPLETELRLDIEPIDPKTLSALKDFLENELKRGRCNSIDVVDGCKIRVFSDGIWADEESSGIGNFSEVENLLSKLEQITPGYKGEGDWRVDFTVVDAPPDHWTFEWSDSKVVNVVNVLEQELEEASGEWDKIFSNSLILKPEMFEYYIYECGMRPQATLFELEMEDPDEPFDDDETLTYGEAVCELAAFVGEDVHEYEDDDED